MKRISRVISAMLVMALFLSPIMANGSSESTKESANGAGGPAGTITFVVGSTQSQGIQAAFDAYQKINPNAEIDIVPFQTVTDFETMMTGYIAADTLPDMYLTQVGATQQEYAANGYLLPLTDTGVMDNLIAGDTELISYNGDIYAFPMIVEVSSIIANNEVLKKAGINVDANNFPRCWDEFIDMLDKLVAAGVKYPVGIAGKDSSSVTAWTFQYIYQSIYGEDPNWYANILRGERAWNDELYLEMFRKYGEMKKYISPAALGSDTNALYRSFITGECAIMFQVMHNVANIRQINPDMDVICLPSCFNDEIEDQTVISGFGDGVSICADTDNKELCIDFLKFLTSDEGSTLYINGAKGVPSTKVNHATTDPAYSLMLEVMQKGSLGSSPILSRQWIPGVKEVMKTAQQNWLAGMDAMDAATEIQIQHERLVKGNPEWVKSFLDSYVDK